MCVCRTFSSSIVHTELSLHHRPSTGVERSHTFGQPAPSYEGFEDLCPTCPQCPKCSEGRGALFAPPYRTFGTEYKTRKTGEDEENRREEEKEKRE